MEISSSEYCPVCKAKGEIQTLRTYRINFQESIFLCENPQVLHWSPVLLACVEAFAIRLYTFRYGDLTAFFQLQNSHVCQTLTTCGLVHQAELQDTLVPNLYPKEMDFAEWEKRALLSRIRVSFWGWKWRVWILLEKQRWLLLLIDIIHNCL